MTKEEKRKEKERTYKILQNENNIYVENTQQALKI